MPSEFGISIGQSAAILILDQKSDSRNVYLFIKTAANIFLASDKFYEVLLVLYSLLISVTSF